jgi:hypothetical protein
VCGGGSDPSILEGKKNPKTIKKPAQCQKGLVQHWIGGKVEEF